MTSRGASSSSTSRRYVSVAMMLGGFLILLGTLAISTASNSVPDSKLGRTAAAIMANDLKPAACAGIFVERVVVRTNQGTVQGGNGNSLLLSSTAKKVMAGSGDDCVVAAGSVDIDGGAGTNACLAGPGSTFKNCAIAIIQ